ncbi:MAG: glycosyltransferase [Ardenticatenaceae bacterium]|nr:glycosyltransferase [Ardenticatenaceae bacterium]
MLVSFYEGFGLPILEAMACETPVIAANTTAAGEIVGVGGFAVDPHSVAAIRKPLTRCWPMQRKQRAWSGRGAGLAALGLAGSGRRRKRWHCIITFWKRNSYGRNSRIASDYALDRYSAGHRKMRCLQADLLNKGVVGDGQITMSPSSAGRKPGGGSLIEEIRAWYTADYHAGTAARVSQLTT